MVAIVLLTIILITNDTISSVFICLKFIARYAMSIALKIKKSNATIRNPESNLNLFFIIPSPFKDTSAKKIQHKRLCIPYFDNSCHLEYT